MCRSPRGTTCPLVRGTSSLSQYGSTRGRSSSQLDQASICRGSWVGASVGDVLTTSEGESLTECLDSRTKPRSARTRCACSCAPISTRMPGPAPPGSRGPRPRGLPGGKRRLPRALLHFIDSGVARASCEIPERLLRLGCCSSIYPALWAWRLRLSRAESAAACDPGTGGHDQSPVDDVRVLRPGAAPEVSVDDAGAPHLPPCTDEQPQLSIVERVTVAFLDRYLKGKRGALARMASAAERPGIAALQSVP